VPSSWLCKYCTSRLISELPVIQSSQLLYYRVADEGLPKGTPHRSFRRRCCSPRSLRISLPRQLASLLYTAAILTRFYGAHRNVIVALHAEPGSRAVTTQRWKVPYRAKLFEVRVAFLEMPQVWRFHVLADETHTDLRR